MQNSIDSYLQSLLNIIANSRIVRASDIHLDRRTSHIGLIRGDLFFADGSRLHFRELVNAQEGVQRLMYSYHYQEEGGSLQFRYDDTPHHPELSSFPHHRHDAKEENVSVTETPNLQ
jgi:hypothetical protein